MQAKKSYLQDAKKWLELGIVDEIEKSLDNGEQRQLLRDILIRQGYVHRNEYDEHGFVCTLINRYAVTQSFPALRKKDIPNVAIFTGLIIINFRILIIRIKGIIEISVCHFIQTAFSIIFF